MDKDTIIVPVGETAWELAEDEGYYIRPTEIDNRDIDYIAFYRTSPISAITHIGDIKKFKKRNSSFMDAGTQLSLLGDFKIEVDYIEIDDLSKIDNVDAKGRSIQKYWYANSDEIKSANRLKDLL